MAAVIPEAAEAVSEGTSAVRGAESAGRHAKPVSRVQQGRERRAAERTAQQRAQREQRTAQRTLQRQQAEQQRTAQRRRQRVQRAAQSAGRSALSARVPGNRQYQPAILAEFLVAILITAVAPLAEGGDKTAQQKGGPSPYSSDTLKQLVAIGAAYFLLAIMSGSRKYGRTAAWFGGLILLAVGLNSFVTGGLVAIFGIFGPNPLTSPPDTSGEELGQALQGADQAAQNVGVAAAGGIPPTPTGTSPFTTSVTGGGVETQSVTFTQPGVATTTEATPGVQVT